MDIFDNLYTVALKNKHFLPHAVLIIIGMITKKRIEEDEWGSVSYLGDNLPFSMIERLQARSIKVSLK